MMNSQIRTTPISESEPPTRPEDIMNALRSLPSRRWSQVMTFVEFLMYQEMLENDESEDEMAWGLREAEHAYRQRHPEDVMTFDSAEAFADFLEG